MVVDVDYQSGGFVARVALPALNGQLQGEQLIEGQPPPGAFPRSHIVWIVGLLDSLAERRQTSAKQQFLRQKVVDPAEPLTQGLPHDAPHVAARQTLGQRIDGHLPPSMDWGLPLVQNLVVGRVEDQLSPEHFRFAADGYAGVGFQCLGHVPLAEPDHPDVAGLVAQHGLGVGPVPLGPLLECPRLPHGAHHGARFIVGHFGYGGDFGVVEVPPREQVEQVPNRGDFQSFELGG